MSQKTERSLFKIQPEDMSVKDIMKKQSYAPVGAHSAVKTCTWLKNAINDRGVCYKSKFYGVSSHRCLQMTPTLSCNQKCIFCWRPTEIKVPDLDLEKMDKPELIVYESIKAQRKLLTGFGGSPNAVSELYNESKTPSNVAISLSGEPTLYPYLPELIDLYKKENMSVFLVTNGTNPEMIQKVKPTQLYMSLDAPDFETYLNLCRPENENQWSLILESLKKLNHKRKEGVRTALRITAVKDLNTSVPKGFSELIKIAEPDFIEIKSYMHVGFSRLRLNRSNMMEMDELKEFASKIAKHLDYKFAGESEPSRVVLLTKDGTVNRINV